MGNVIDSLIVELALDAKGIQKGSKEAEEYLKKVKSDAGSTFKTFQDEGKKATDAFTSLRNEALTLITVFTAGVGLKQFTEQTIQSSSQTFLLSQNLGESTDKITAWELANQKAGGTVAGMTAQLKESADEVARYKSGFQMNTGQSFFMAGGSMAGVNTSTDYLIARAKVLAKLYQEDPKKAALWAKNMGISEDTFNLLKQGPDMVIKLVEAQAKNAAITDQLGKNAYILRGRWVELSNSLQATGKEVVLDLIPGLEKILSSFQGQSNWVASHRNDIKNWIDSSTGAFIKFAEKAGEGERKIKGWADAFAKMEGLDKNQKWLGLAALAVVLWNIQKALAGVAAVAAPALIPLAAAAYILKPKELNTGEDAALKQWYIDHGKTTPEGAEDSKELFKSIEKKWKLKPGTLDSMWLQESSRGKKMLSPAGAKGHFGLMPLTAKQYGVQDPNDLHQSAEGAAHYMSDLLKKYKGNYNMALAGYNEGPGNLDRRGLANSPLETRNYVREVGGRIDQAQNTSEVNFNAPITINTQATDGEGVARDFREHMKNWGVVAQTSTGLTS